MPERVALLFAYDGSLFDGYARQPHPGARTVEGALMDALVAAGLASDRDALAWRTGSRTDKGVSARENVVVFSSGAPAVRVPAALGGRVDGVWPIAAASVPEDFDPRRAAGREYRYFLSGTWTRGERRALEQALSLFVGRHDFSSFARMEEGRDPMRRVDVVAVEDGDDGLVLRVRGGSFLWQQVRRMVSAAKMVAAGALSEDQVKAALAGQARVDVAAAAPGPLVLWQVDYVGLRFARSEDAWARLAEKRADARSAAWARASLYRDLGLVG